MIVQSLVNSVSKNRRKIFIIDGIGAFLSAFLLGVVLVRLESFFGIPVTTLYVLASLPLFFACYDFYSYQQPNNKLSRLLKGISIMNLMYCCLSIGLVFFHHQLITLWGWIYIIGEVIIVLLLSLVELKLAKKSSSI